MGWSDCGTDSGGRPIGYVFKATCDHPGCEQEIDRGLSYACGGMHGQLEYGCEKYFCCDHLIIAEVLDDEFKLICPTCYEENLHIWNAREFNKRILSSYSNEQYRELALKEVFLAFRGATVSECEAILGELILDDLEVELIVCYGMAANAHVGKDHPVRNSFCSYVLSYFDEINMDKETVRSVFSIDNKEQE